METSSLFTVALNLESPWRVSGVNFVPTGTMSAAWSFTFTWIIRLEAIFLAPLQVARRCIRFTTAKSVLGDI